MKIIWIIVRLTIVTCYLYSTFYWQHFKLSIFALFRKLPGISVLTIYLHSMFSDSKGIYCVFV